MKPKPAAPQTGAATPPATTQPASAATPPAASTTGEPETPEGEGDGEGEPETPPAGEPETTPATATVTTGMSMRGILQAAAVSLKSKASLSAELAAAVARAETAEKALAAANTAKETMAAELTDLKTQVAKLGQALDTAAKEKTTVADTVAAAGFPANQLPAAATAGEDTLENVRERLKTTTDIRERARLAKLAKQLRREASDS